VSALDAELIEVLEIEATIVSLNVVDDEASLKAELEIKELTEKLTDTLVLEGRTAIFDTEEITLDDVDEELVDVLTDDEDEELLGTTPLHCPNPFWQFFASQ
jgi:hypothetical protein